jgi:hypothetical protein
VGFAAVHSLEAVGPIIVHRRHPAASAPILTSQSISSESRLYNDVSGFFGCVEEKPFRHIESGYRKTVKNGDGTQIPDFLRRLAPY